jgi:uncharacterized repeat protein (TIGR01451 family)
MKKFRFSQKIKTLYKQSLCVLSATVLAVVTALGPISLSPAHAAIGSISEYSIPYQPNFIPDSLAAGPDGNIWFTGFQRIAKLTPSGSMTVYLRSATLSTAGIITGSDGNLWFGEGATIVNMTTGGTVLGTYNIPSGKSATSMTLGSDGAVWFTETMGVGKDITTGPDGNVWFTYDISNISNDKIGMITPSGVITYYSLPSSIPNPESITAGSDGNLWFTSPSYNKIGKITTSGVITDYALPNSPTGPMGITTGSDSALWYTGTASSKIGRMTTSGVVTAEYSVPNATSGSLRHIITGTDGAVWYINYDARKIGRVATELSSQTISFTSSAPTNAIVDGPTYTPSASSTSSLSVDITVDTSSSGVCSIDGSGKVNFQGAGTCMLNANQAGDADYNPAPQVQQSFAVAPILSDTSVEVDCPTTASIGNPVACTITVSNDGPAVAENLSLTALFPNSFSGTSLSGGGTLSGQLITWSASSLASGSSVVLTFDATASIAARASLSAALLQTNPDSDISNNIDDAKILIN